jgi:membrane-associated phospholipid phosphatase
VNRFGLLAVLCLAGHRAAAQAVAEARPLVRWPEALGFVALTGITFVTDERIRGTILGHNSGFRNTAAEIGNAFGNPRYVLPALVLGTISGKLAGWSDIHEPGWRALKSTALASGTALVLKSLIGRRRPDVSPDGPYRFSPLSFRFNSLPSGHTATAFGRATSLAMESRSHLADIVLYGLATTTAFARMHIDRHWASDTVVGAGVGILAARYVRRHDHSTGGGSFTIAGSLRF